MTAILPSQFDLHAAGALAGLLGRSPLFDHCVESALHHDLLGGIPFAGAVFYFWVQAEREDRQDVLRRIITILIGSFAAIVLALIAGRMISWLPPQRQPGLSHLYPAFLIPDVNINSFPSDSTAVFTAVAMGIPSINRIAGLFLLAAVPLFVSLPRMYVGGHYPTDVLAGLLIGILGYTIGRYGFESGLSGRILAFGRRPGARRVMLETCMFLWILELAVNFREGVWILNTLRYFHMRVPF
jgi:membrane-associated phospholipid phosphatase